MPEDRLTPKLRPATVADTDLLLSWRNDPETRRQSKTSGEISRQDHVAWLDGVLADPDRRLLIAEADGGPVGSVRADRQAECWLLSWAVAPPARGKGYGKAIVAAMVDGLQGEIRAEVKSDNTASLRIAEAVGMTKIGEIDGLTLWAVNK